MKHGMDRIPSPPAGVLPRSDELRRMILTNNTVRNSGHLL